MDPLLMDHPLADPLTDPLVDPPLKTKTLKIKKWAETQKVVRNVHAIVARENSSTDTVTCIKPSALDNTNAFLEHKHRMWGVVQTLVVSIGIIWSIHMLIQYLQETYTVKKNKDMLGIYTEKYEKMLDELTSRPVQPTTTT